MIDGRYCRGGQRSSPSLNLVVAVVELMAGPHRLVSLMTAEAADELGIEVGLRVIAVVKATDVIVEIPAAKVSSP